MGEIGTCQTAVANPKNRGIWSIGAVGRCLSRQLAENKPLTLDCRSLVIVAAPKVPTSSSCRFVASFFVMELMPDVFLDVIRLVYLPRSAEVLRLESPPGDQPRVLSRTLFVLRDADQRCGSRVSCRSSRVGMLAIVIRMQSSTSVTVRCVACFCLRS